MPDPGPLRFRRALPTDAAAIAALHADSWQRHYRGAFSDAFLDGDVETDRAAVWTERFGAMSDREHTHLAEERGVLVGFVHTVLDADPTWGALLDNLHVVHDRQRGGIGARLLRLSAETVVNHSPGSGLHLWVLEQNTRAQAFYQALGGKRVERDKVPPPAGDPGRLNGSPMRLRYAWPEPGELGGS